MGTIAKLFVVITLWASFAARADLPCGVTVGPPTNTSSSLPALDTCGAMAWALPGSIVGLAAGVGLSVAGGAAIGLAAPCGDNDEWCGPVLYGIGIGLYVVPVAVVLGAAAGMAVGFQRAEEAFAAVPTTPHRESAPAEHVGIDTDGVDDPADDELDGIDRRTDDGAVAPAPAPMPATDEPSAQP